MPERTGRADKLSFPLCFWIVAEVIAAADLLTKHVMFVRLPHESSTPIEIIPGLLRFVHAENYGGVFGLAQGSMLWLVFAVVAANAVVWFAHRKESLGILTQVGLGLVLAGAIGNIYDRITFSYVRDFIDVYITIGGKMHEWPAFNVADAGICVGAIYLAGFALFSGDKKKPAKAKQSAR